jgi:hypothetical protein
VRVEKSFQVGSEIVKESATGINVSLVKGRLQMNWGGAWPRRSQVRPSNPSLMSVTHPGWMILMGTLAWFRLS